MILERDQIHRYMRHIIMSEIGGVGQKKLLNSTVLLYCSSLHNAAVPLYYLTAMGIGEICCITEEMNEERLVLENIRKLNPETKLDIVLASDIQTSRDYSSIDAVMAICESGEAFVEHGKPCSIPLILAAADSGYGFLKTFGEVWDAAVLEKEIGSFYSPFSSDRSSDLLHKACVAFVGVLASIETVKAILGIGSACKAGLQFDLLNNNFVYGESLQKRAAAEAVSDCRIKPLKDLKVLMVGCGGLGSPAAYMLADMGIGRIGLLDYDNVEISNLNRQILHATERIGMPKVKSAEEFLRALNPEMEITTHQERFSAENAEALIKAYDIIIDGLDNLPTRYLLNDVCCLYKKPLIEAGVLGFNGLATAIIPGQGPCYRCTFPREKDDSTVPSCSETGVMGAVPGVMGILQALEVLKLTAGIGTSLVSKILLMDALNMDFTVLDIFRDESCAVCGSHPSIQTLRDEEYEFVCTTK